MSENRDHYNHAGMLAFLFSMAFVFVFFIYIVVVHPGVDLQEDIKSPQTEEGTEKVAKVDVSKITELWVSSEDLISHGKQVYGMNCAMCHGAEGKGDGAAGAALNPKPRNLITGPWKKGGGLIGHYTVLTEGIAGSSMSAYAHLPPVDRWAMAHYIESITEAKVDIDPAKVAEFAKTAK